MIYAKIGAMCLSLIGFGGWAWFGQISRGSVPPVAEVKTKMPDVSPEVREKAFGLLDRVLVEAQSSKSKKESIQIQFLLTDLLWEKDEPRARALFASLAADADKEECYCNVIELGRIVERDSKLALKIAESSKSGISESLRDEVYSDFVKQYPDDAFREAKSAVEDNNYLSYLSLSNADVPGNTLFKRRRMRLEKLYSANKSYGANLASDILKKLGQAPLRVPTPYPLNPYYGSLPASNAPAANRAMPIGNFANANTVANRPRNANLPIPPLEPDGGRSDKRVPFSAATSLLLLAIESRDESEKTGEVALLTEPEIRVLARMMVQALTKAKRFDDYDLRPVYTHLKKYAPVEFARLGLSLTGQRKDELGRVEAGKANSAVNAVRTAANGAVPWGDNTGEFGRRNNPIYNQIPAPPNESPEAKAEREFVNDVRLYSQITNFCNVEDQAVRFAGLSHQERYPDLSPIFNDYLPMAYAKVGKLDKLRPLLAKETSRSIRSQMLSLAAAAMALRGDRAGAEKIAHESAELLPKEIFNRNDFAAIEAYSLAAARIDANIGFAGAERLIDESNTLLQMSSKLKEFKVIPDYTDNYDNLLTLRGRFATYSPNLIQLIKTLAAANFDRTVKLSERFTDPEVRLFFRWYMVNSLLNKNAPAEEDNYVERDICG